MQVLPGIVHAVWHMMHVPYFYVLAGNSCKKYIEGDIIREVCHCDLHVDLVS